MKNVKLLLLLLFFSAFVACSSGKDEFACIINKCAGTRCDKSIGNTCSSTHDCTPVPSGCGNQQFTRTNVDVETSATQHANYLLEKGFIRDEHIEDVKQLVRNILKPENGNSVISK